MVDEETKMNDEERWSDEILRRINASIDRSRDAILTSRIEETIHEIGIDKVIAAVGIDKVKAVIARMDAEKEPAKKTPRSADFIYTSC